MTKLLTPSGALFTRQSEMAMMAHLAASKSLARKLVLQLIADSDDSVAKAQATNIISLLTDAENNLTAAVEALEWE